MQGITERQGTEQRKGKVAMLDYSTNVEIERRSGNGIKNQDTDSPQGH